MVKLCGEVNEISAGKREQTGNSEDVAQMTV